MRAFCLLLILANALFFAWAHMIDVKPGALERPRVAGAQPPPRIVLAREAAGTEPRPAAEMRRIEPPRVDPLDDGNEALAATQPAPARADAGAHSCVSVGPFAELADSAQAQAAIRNAGLEPRQRVEMGEVWAGYWVSVRDFATRKEADAALARLAENGIGDAYILTGEDEYVLSVGVFSDHQRAQRRAAQVRAQGFAVQIADRKRAGSVYWIDVDLTSPAQTLDMSMFQQEPGKIMRLELRACPRGA